ncbi:hypothetical protein JVT61DRAFT_6121 [Boletus reticuloceps]|uniref:Uncharacterized protein n=1 Tax=Boletus reticuloceps TaxID=495285 RepID=A0A8I3A8J6_9AGAM|nr:hypothetical protein JVT61DRAFT_6121 [Boletus reticuloceps]
MQQCDHSSHKYDLCSSLSSIDSVRIAPVAASAACHLPPSLVFTEGMSAVQTMAVTSIIQVINMAIPQNDTTVATSAPPTLSDVPTLQPQLPLAPSQQNDPPHTYTYNYHPQTAIDPLDQFLAKYPPDCLLQPHPSFPTMPTGTSNKLAVPEQTAAAAASTAAPTQVVFLTCNNMTTPHTNTTSAAPLAPSTLSKPPPSQPQLPMVLPPSQNDPPQADTLSTI